MSIIKCPECNKEISNKALKCPNCGYPISENNKVYFNNNNFQNRLLKNSTILCPECNQEISNKSKRCPYCGNRIKVRDSFLSLLSLACTLLMCTLPLGVIFAIIDLWKSRGINSDKTKTHAGSKLSLIIFGVIIFCYMITKVGSSKKEKDVFVLSESEITESSTQENSTKQETTSEKQTEANEQETSIDEKNEQETTVNMEELSEDEYKTKCKQIYYEDISNNENIKKGDYIKIDIYLEQAFIEDIDQMLTDSFWKDNNLKSTYFEFGVLCRQYENNYGGQNYLLFSNSNGIEPDMYQCGDYLTVYGKIIDKKTNGWTGKNILYIVPKYIN